MVACGVKSIRSPPLTLLQIASECLMGFFLEWISFLVSQKNGEEKKISKNFSQNQARESRTLR
jgi:hypothetical protein